MSALRPAVKPRLQPLASFSYRGDDVAVELTEDGNAAAVKCPVCGEICRVNLETHEIIINLRTRRAATIYPTIICPSAQCGFCVVVFRGRAVEVDANRVPEEPWREVKAGELRCEECRRPFRYGRMKQRVCQRCTPNNRGKWSTRKKG